MINERLENIQKRYNKHQYVVSFMGQDHSYAHVDISYMLKEIKRLQAIEQALIDFHADMLPSKTYTANHVYDWIHSTTGYKGME